MSRRISRRNVFLPGRTFSLGAAPDGQSPIVVRLKSGSVEEMGERERPERGIEPRPLGSKPRILPLEHSSEKVRELTLTIHPMGFEPMSH